MRSLSIMCAAPCGMHCHPWWQDWMVTHATGGQRRQVQDAVLRNIEVMGEAARSVQRVAPDLVRAHADIPWAAMVAMRTRRPRGLNR